MTQKKLGVVVVLKKKFIMGLITDGDLRREIKFKDISKNKNLLNFITKNPLGCERKYASTESFGYYE